jgi:NADH-quinone oxidoreductase subunit B
MSTLVDSSGLPLAPALPGGGAVTAPDRHFFNDLNSQVSDKGFLVTNTEDCGG